MAGTSEGVDLVALQVDALDVFEVGGGMRRVLVTAAEGAVWTGKSEVTIWRWAAQNRVTRVKTPQGTRFDLSELPPKVNGKPGNAPPVRTDIT